jgi:23S rRNA pseudouridine1911/1915/1917 synthase
MDKSASDNASRQSKCRKGPRRKTRKPPDKLIVPQEAELFHVYPDQAGMRLDQFLKMRLHWRSRTKVQELIEEREITSGGARLDCSYRVKLAEEIRLPLPPPPEAAFRIAEIPLEVLYEDDLLIILNKPPHLVVHPAGRHRYDTLINALHLRYRDLDDAKKDIIPRLAHRIDRETSGVLIAYKMRRHDRASPMVFERTKVVKEYLTLAEGVMEDDSGVIDLPIGRQPNTPHDQAQVTVHAGGQASRTGYTVLERFRHFTLLRCRLFTGRMHQIRVHLQAIGHPVVCDKKYGLRAELRRSDLGPLPPDEEDVVLLDRQALHAHQLTFKHPVNGSPMFIEAPLPPDMQRVLEALRAT